MMGSGFEDLVLVDGEVFAEAGNGDGARGNLEIAEAALKKRLIGEDGEGCGAAVLIAGGEPLHIEVGADEAFGRRSFLDFGDDGGAGLRALAECGCPSAGLVERGEALQFRGGDAGLRRGDDSPGAVEDGVELVPKPAVVAVARMMFGENYACTRMSHAIHLSEESGVVTAEYVFGDAAEQCVMRIEAESASFVPHDESLAQFITEHYWGYARRRNGSTLEYEVQHPRWQVREASHAEFRGNAEMFYGAEFARVLDRPPDSAFLAEGSAVTVFRGIRI